MKVSVLLAAVWVGVALAEESIQLYYHESVGIPEAARIKLAEDEADLTTEGLFGEPPVAFVRYPFLVGLVITLTSGATSMCGTSMLSNTRALTAAHCWWDGRNQASSFTMVFGSARLLSGGTRVDTSNVVVHANYDPNTLNNDVAIIVHNWIDYSNSIRSVRLAQNNLFTGEFAQAVGYGNTSGVSGTFQRAVRLQAISNADCRRTFGSNVINSTLCAVASVAGRQTICSGVSGGPLYIMTLGGPVLIGVTSFGSARGCQADLTTAFARVPAFLPWIQERL